MEGVPPIDVYKIGDVYFVRDGNHRVSVARQLGVSHIQANVTEIQTRVPLSPADSPDDIIIKSEYADFLARTELDERYPDAQLFVTAPGRYSLLLDEIEGERYRMALQRGEAVELPEAAAYWYTERYEPLIKMMRERGMLRDFPGRTETDLYTWVIEHRASVAEELGWSVDPVDAANDLVEQQSLQPERVAARIGARILETIRPATFAPGPSPGAWRREHAATEALFADLLLPLGPDSVSSRALEQALLLAKREGARLVGVHVVANEAERGSASVRALQDAFAQRCAAAQVVASTAIAVGEVASRIAERAHWADLVVVQVNHPPDTQPLGRLRSGLRELIQRCPLPLLAVPGAPTPLDKALLAYDGSPKADEALYVAAYLALRWGTALVVATVVEDGRAASTSLERARAYLDERRVAAEFVVAHGSVADALLRLTDTHSCDLLISGGYGLRPELALLMGSTVELLLRQSRVPLLICR
jgi:nucleotide-binding universal stress UspA family protein